MTTLQQEHSRNACYYGERGDWLIAYAIHRDSGTLERSNWTAFLETLGGEGGTIAIERSSHWAVGWVDYLVIDPSDKAKVELAESLRARLEDYPVLDEMEWSKLEWEEYGEAWNDYGADEFVRELGKAFRLADATKDFLAEVEREELQEFFEACVPSGEYYIPGGSGVSVNIRSAIVHCTREALAAFLRTQRVAV